ncbi:hypothetical protein AB0N46_32190, partial [Streptomyces albidoflavus]
TASYTKADWQRLKDEFDALHARVAELLAQGVPVLHMVNAFRYGILGVSDIRIGIAITFMLVATVVLYFGCARLLVSGRGMRT